MASNMQGSTRSSSPAWEMDMEQFLDSQDGIKLFHKFLVQELGEDIATHVMEFRHCLSGSGLRDKSNTDPDFRKLLKAFKKYVKFFANKEQAGFFQVSYLEDYLVLLNKKENQAAFNILEELQSNINIQLENRCWPNFLKDDIFLGYANGENSIDEEGCGSDQSPAKLCQTDLNVGMSTIPEDNATTTTKEKPAVAKKPDLPKRSEDCRPSHQETDAIGFKFNNKEEFDPSKVHVNPYDPAFDPPDVRDRETLQVRPEFEKYRGSSQNLRNTHGLNHIPEYDNRRDVRTSTLPREYPNASRTFQRGQKTFETYIDEQMPRQNAISNPYHVVNPTTVNPTTRQPSAFHSMATTDASDNYSSFSTEDPSKVERRRIREEKRVARESSQTNAHAKQSLTGPFKPANRHEKDQIGVHQSKLAQNEPEEFAKLLKHKLKNHLDQINSRASFKEMLRRNAEERQSNPAMSQVGVDYEETDDSILDDHCSRVESSQRMEEMESSRRIKKSFGSSDNLLNERSHRSYNQRHHYNTSTMKSNRSSSNRDYADGRSTISRAPSSFQGTTRVPSIQEFENYNGDHSQYNTMRSSHLHHGSSQTSRNTSQDQFGQFGQSGFNGSSQVSRSNASLDHFGQSGYPNGHSISSYNQYLGQSRQSVSNGYAHSQQNYPGSSDYARNSQNQNGFGQQQHQLSWNGNNSYNGYNRTNQAPGFGNQHMSSRFGQMYIDERSSRSSQKRGVEIEVTMNRKGEEKKHTTTLYGKVITLNDILDELPGYAAQYNFHQLRNDANFGHESRAYHAITPAEPLMVLENKIILKGFQ